MARSRKLFSEVIRNPARFWRMPGDVLRDRRFADAERLAILRAWAAADGEREAEIAPMLKDLEDRGPGLEKDEAAQ